MTKHHHHHHPGWPGPFRCENCRHACDMRVDDVAKEELVRTGDTAIHPGDLPATLTCGRCGWTQSGVLRGMEICLEHGALLGGEYVKPGQSDV